MNNVAGQIVCECGHVAEIRLRRNGQRLPFKACKHCGVQQGKEPVRARWLAEMQPSIGTYGEKAPETSNGAEPEPVPTLSEVKDKVKTDWVPPAELAPESAEPKPAPDQEKPDEDKKSGKGWLVGLGVLGLGVLAALGLARTTS